MYYNPFLIISQFFLHIERLNTNKNPIKNCFKIIINYIFIDIVSENVVLGMIKN